MTAHRTHGNNNAFTRLPVYRRGVADTDKVVVEEPLEIRVNAAPFVVIMRTPGHDAELAAGLLFTEGVLQSAEELIDITPCANASAEAAGNVLVARVSAAAEQRAATMSRSTAAYSSCGVCGKTSIDQVQARGSAVADSPAISESLLVQLPDTMRADQRVFDETGGLHAAALFDRTGTLLCLREDVGRHNAVDKIVGFAVHEDRLPLSNTILLVSGRAGFEIIQKAGLAGIGIVASVSAVSSLAVSLAQIMNITLAGFVRNGAVAVYSHPQRITDSTPSPKANI